MHRSYHITGKTSKLEMQSVYSSGWELISQVMFRLLIFELLFLVVLLHVVLAALISLQICIYEKTQYKQSILKCHLFRNLTIPSLLFGALSCKKKKQTVERF